MSNDYYIERINELQEENENLKELLSLLGASCKDYNGKECMRYNNRDGCEYCNDYDPHVI